MARLTFSNVPTAGGGVISGNISTGPGSPFGAGGKYEAQVSDIKATIAKAPKGFYDPVGWDDFLRKKELYSEELPEGVRFIGADDPELMDALLNIPSARDAMIGLNQLGLGYEGRTWEACPKCSPAQHVVIAKKRDNYYDILALHVNQLMLEKNAPLIQAVEQKERQLEIDQAVKIALEQKIRETATPKPTPTPEPTPTPTTPVSTISILPIILGAVALIGILLFLRSRA